MDTEIDFVVDPVEPREVPVTPKVMVIGGGESERVRVAVAAATQTPSIPLPVRNPPALGPILDDVEYDFQLPGGGHEIVNAKSGASALDTLARAQKRLMQLKAVNNMLKEIRGHKASQAGKHARKAKARKKNKMAKASRKRNR